MDAEIICPTAEIRQPKPCVFKVTLLSSSQVLGQKARIKIIRKIIRTSKSFYNFV